MKNIVEINGLIAQHLEKHCTPRWIKVLVELIEQFENLKEYFLKTLPEFPGFKAKSGIGSTTRCKSTKDYLTDQRVLILDALCSFSCTRFMKSDCYEVIAEKKANE